MNSGDSIRPASSEELVLANAEIEAEKNRVAALSLFARRMSHDLNNFITVVRTYSELLLTDLSPTSPMHADVLEIHNASEAMIEYVHRVARFARASAGKAGAVKLDEAVADIVREASAIYQVMARVQSGAVVHVDALWLADSLRELFTNAREASAPDDMIRVNTFRRVLDAPIVDGGVPISAGLWAVVEILDGGAGFPLANRQSLDPFVTTKTGVRGAGFGLALVRGTVWQAGGQVALCSAPISEVGARASAANPAGCVRLWLPAAISSSP